MTENMINIMTVDADTFFQAIDPRAPLFIDNEEIDEKYYIDFSPVRGQQVIKDLKSTITRWSKGKPTCQLFTGHIGCGKSTELWRLKQQLETAGYHVVYFESEKNLEMVDVDVSDILLTIAQKVSESLEKLERLNLEEPKRLKGLLQSIVKLLQTEIEFSAETTVPGVGKLSASSDGSFSADLGMVEVKADEEGLEFVASGIGKISAQAKGSPELRTKLREYLGPRTPGIIEMINKELLEPADQKLKEYGKKGLVVIADNLDKVDSSPKPWGRNQQEYLFVDRGEQLTSLQCHLIYTLPIALRFSNDYGTLTQRFETPKILPMVATQLRDGSECIPGMELMRQLVLARAFPELKPQERLARVTEVFDSQETLDYLCWVSGGHVRNMFRMVLDALKEEDDLPISRGSVNNVVRNYRNEQLLAIDDHEWELLRQVVQTKKVTGDDGYQILIRSMFVYEYQYNQSSWFNINPLLKDAPELKIS